MSSAEVAEDASRAVIRGAFEVLAAMEQLGTCRVSEVQRHCGLPRTTVHRLLAQLAEVGAVERSGRGWRLGPTLVELGAGVPAEPRLRRVARRPLLELANATGGLVALSVDMSGHAVVVEVFPGRTPLPLEPEQGMVLGGSQMAVVRAHEQARRGDMRAVVDAGGIHPDLSCVAAPMKVSSRDVAVVWLMVPGGAGVPEPAILATRRIAGVIASSLSGGRL